MKEAPSKKERTIHYNIYTAEVTFFFLFCFVFLTKKAYEAKEGC